MTIVETKTLPLFTKWPEPLSPASRCAAPPISNALRMSARGILPMDRQGCSSSHNTALVAACGTHGRTQPRVNRRCAESASFRCGGSYACAPVVRSVGQESHRERAQWIGGS